MLKLLSFNGYMCPSFSNRPNILYLCHDFGAYFNKRIRVRVVKKIFINTNISTLHVARHNADKHPCCSLYSAHSTNEYEIYSHSLFLCFFYHQERRRRLDEEKKAEKEIDRLKDEIEKLKRRYGVSLIFF